MIKIPIKALSVNEAWKGRRYKTDKYEQYEKDFCKVVPVAKEMIMGIVEIIFYFHLINHKGSDYDNLIKNTQDLLVKRGYIKDDRFIYKATIYKIPSKINYTEVEIKNYPI